jgi:hypothetical protein
MSQQTPIDSIELNRDSSLYRVRDDPAEETNLAGTAEEKRAAEKLRAALIEMEAPADQFARLALA